jgi:hypothetical protein
MKGRSIVILIVVAGAAFGLLMFWWARKVGFPRHPEVQPVAAAPAAKPISAAAAMASAKKVEGQQASTRMHASTSTNTETSAEESKPDKQAILLKAALSFQKQNSERFTRAVARWDKEKRDAKWAQGRENALRLALEGDNIQITPDQLECRATLCRLALHPPNPLPNAPRMRSEIGDATAVGSEGTGAARMFILFIPRSGQSLDG